MLKRSNSLLALKSFGLLQDPKAKFSDIFALFLNFKNNLFHEHYFNLLIWSEAIDFTPHFGMMAWQIF